MRRRARSPNRGFTYVGVLALVAITGIGASGLGTLWQTAAQREKERELLEAGSEIQRAIRAYVTSRGVGRAQYPRSLDDLVLDPRHPVVVRHLRRIRADPMTGKPDWGLVTTPDGAIMGVHSLSQAAPLKQTGFDAGGSAFEHAQRYADWHFVYRLPAPSTAVPGRGPARP